MGIICHKVHERPQTVVTLHASKMSRSLLWNSSVVDSRRCNRGQGSNWDNPIDFALASSLTKKYTLRSYSLEYFFNTPNTPDLALIGSRRYYLQEPQPRAHPSSQFA